MTDVGARAAASAAVDACLVAVLYGIHAGRRGANAEASVGIRAGGIESADLARAIGTGHATGRRARAAASAAVDACLVAVLDAVRTGGEDVAAILFARTVVVDAAVVGITATAGEKEGERAANKQRAKETRIEKGALARHGVPPILSVVGLFKFTLCLQVNQIFGVLSRARGYFIGFLWGEMRKMEGWG